MRFGEHFIDELKARIRPSDVVGRHVKLKRQGREFAGLSPFTTEKTPSFFVNDEKGFYHCFSSGKHGDVIGFLMEIEGLAFPEAVERLAMMAGMEMPQSDPDSERRAERNKKTVSWMEQAQLFFARSLLRDVGSQARDYLKKRGLSRTAAESFGLGFAPASFQALRDELIQEGASVELLIEAGLVVDPEDKSREPWDRFRNRIMFPIHDARGRLVAFGGRAMEADAKAKYLNSPETPLFQKGRLLYNYPKARKALLNPQYGAGDKALRGLIVVEGYMDVIALSRAGFAHAVAPLGTALTGDQLDLLWRAGSEPILCFDGDQAGVRAAFRSIERALPKLKPGQSLRFARLPDAQDPDDLIKAKGAPAMQKVLDAAIPLVDMVWQRELEAGPLHTPEDRAGLRDRIYAVLREITHAGVRQQYKTALLDRFDQEFGWQRQDKKGRGNHALTPRKPSSALKAQMKSDAFSFAQERRLIGAIVEWPQLLEHVDEVLFSLSFSSELGRKLQSAILNYWRDIKSVEKRALHAHIEAQGLEHLLKKARPQLDDITRIIMGGSDVTLQHRAALWLEHADGFRDKTQSQVIETESQSRIAEAIETDNSEAMHKQMRVLRETRE